MTQTPYYIYGDTLASLHPSQVLYLPTQQFPDPSQSLTECPGYRNTQEPAYNDPHQGYGYSSPHEGYTAPLYTSILAPCTSSDNHRAPSGGCSEYESWGAPPSYYQAVLQYS